MGTEDSKDVLKSVDWKAVGDGRSGVNGPIPKKRVSKTRFQQIPEYYFLPKRSFPLTLALCGSLVAAGVGAGMVLEVWIKKKIQEDGGVVWEFDKK